MLDPIVLENVTKNGSADRSGQMRPTLAPVETGAAEHPAPEARRRSTPNSSKNDRPASVSCPPSSSSRMNDYSTSRSAIATAMRPAMWS
jgi:hypothetical protein